MAVALLVATIFDRARIDSASVVVPVLLGVAIVMQGEGLAAAGYVDVLGGSLTVLAFVWFIGDRDASIPSATTLAAATLVKAEGFYFAVLLSVVMTWRAERRTRFALIAGAAMIPALIWMGTVRVVTPDLITDVRPGGFLRLLLLDGERWTRARVATPRVLREMWPYLAAAAGVALGLAAARRSGSRRFTLAVGCALASGVTTAAVVAVYAAGLPEIHWWLDTSIQRVLVTPRIFALAAVAVGVHELGGFEQADHRVRARTQGELSASSPS